MEPDETPSPDPSGPDLAALLQRMLAEGVNDPQVAAALREMGVDPTDPAVVSAMHSSLRTFLDPSTRPSNEQTARDAARAATAAAGRDPVVGQVEHREALEAAGVAQLWLDAVTSLGSPAPVARALSRAEWVDVTMPRWDELVAPVARGMSEAISGAMRHQVEQLGALGADDLGPVELPEELAALPGAAELGKLLGNPGALADMVARMGPFMADLSSAFVAAQTGQAVGTLATDMLTGTEVGLPLLPADTLALLPANLTAFAADLQLDAGEVRLYLAVREAARVRLFAAVPWLGPALVTAVQEYAANIHIDTDGIESSLRDLDLSDLGGGDLDAIRVAVQDRIFSPVPTPPQLRALARLETLLALVEGWVDHVTHQAAAAHLPHTDVLDEVVRRRRAGGPAQKAFSALVGLELRPRRLRDAANLWAAVAADAGTDGRDACWAHPDLAPDEADLDDPLGYVERVRRGWGADSLDDELASLLDADRPADGTSTDGPDGDE